MSDHTNTGYPWLTEIYETLRRCLQNNHLSHSHIISGQGDIGQSTLVNQITADVLCLTPIDHKACGQCHSCQLHQSGTHPDMHWLSAERTITASDMRHSLSALSCHPSIALNKVWVIDSLDKLSVDAYQVGLKTIEEPGSNVYIFLLHQQRQSIKPTLRSRCQLWPIEIDYDSWAAHSPNPSRFNYEWLRGSLEPLTSQQQLSIQTCHLLTGVLTELAMAEFTSVELLDLWQAQLLQDMRCRLTGEKTACSASLWQYLKAFDLLSEQRYRWSIHAGLSESMALFNLWHQTRATLGCA